MTNFLEIDESKSKYALDKMKVRSEEWVNLWTKNILMYDAYARFWRPRIDMGKKCYDYRKRKIFTRGQLTKLQVQEKIPIQPQEMKKEINTLCRLIEDMVQTSMVEMEDESPPENAAPPEVVNVVLKWIFEKLKIERKKSNLLEDGLTTGYPIWLWYDLEKAAGEIAGFLVASLLPWESTLCSPNFVERDGSDIDDIIRFAKKTKYQMLKKYPDREKALKQHEAIKDGDPGYIKELLHVENDYTSDDKSSILSDLMQRAKFDSANGFYYAVERVFPVEKTQTVHINEKTKDVLMLPPDWPQGQKDQWLDAHPDYNITRDEPRITLWTTTISTDGFIWENKEHWYQNDGKLPGTPYIASLVDKMPIGAAEDMLPYILAIAVSETEGLDEVRKGTGQFTTVMEGSLMHPKHFNKERASANGVAVIKKNAKAGMDSVHTENRKPNNTFLEFSERSRQQKSEMHGITDAMMGASHPRQSDVAKKRELEQGYGPQNSYVMNYSNFDLDNTQLICSMIPYFLNEHTIIEIKDEYGEKTEQVEVNQQGFDYSGQASTIANDLLSCKYRIIPVPAEDTPTSRQRDMNEFAGLMEALGNSLFNTDPRLAAAFLKKWPNRYAREAGMDLETFAQQSSQEAQQAQQAEQQMEAQKEQGRRAVDVMKIFAPKWNFKVDPEDIANSPQGTKVMFEFWEKYKQEAAGAGSQGGMQ